MRTDGFWRYLRGVLPCAFLCLLLLAVPRSGEAAPDGRACKAEPTDEVISYGDLITCAISPVGDSDTFRFFTGFGLTGSKMGPAERIIIAASRTSGSVLPCIELFGPDGAPVTSACTFSFTNRADVTLAAGTHTILIRNQSTSASGSYTLALERVFPVAPFATVIKYGQTLTDPAIDPVGDFDLFALNGAQGNRISIQTARSTGSVLPCIELYNPNGTLASSACNVAFSNRLDVTLTQNGTHTVLVRDASNSSSGNYTVTLQCIVGSCTDAIPAALGATLSSTSASVAVGATATSFATVTNTGAAADVVDDRAADTAPPDALGCAIGTAGSGFQFSYQAVDPTTNQPIGTANTPVNIVSGFNQKFMISLTPTAPMCPTNVKFNFQCSNGGADTLTGVNTLQLSAGNPPGCGLRTSASVSRSAFTVGQTLVAGGSVTNSGVAGTSADFYAGVLRPDNSILFITPTGTVVGNAGNPGSFRPIAVNVPLATPFSTSQPTALTQQRAPGDAPGTYTFFVAAVKAGTLEILSLSPASYTFP